MFFLFIISLKSKLLGSGFFLFIKVSCLSHVDPYLPGASFDTFHIPFSQVVAKRVGRETAQDPSFVSPCCFFYWVGSDGSSVVPVGVGYSRSWP